MALCVAFREVLCMRTVHKPWNVDSCDNSKRNDDPSKELCAFAWQALP